MWTHSRWLALLVGACATAFAQTDAANAGRLQLTQSLDRLAAQETAARRKAVAKITTKPLAEARQKLVRSTIEKLIGGLPQRTPLNAKSFGTTQAEGFTVERVLFESQPGFRVTALLYLPNGPHKNLPAIVIAPGHSPAGKASDVPFATTFARNGFAVLSYDLIGLGERLEYLDPAKPGKSIAPGTGEHGNAGIQPTLAGGSVARYFASDGIRAIDYLASRPEVDPARIGAFGCSGGGTVTALTAALDPRVKAVGTACFITSYDTLLPSIGPQDAEQSTPNSIAAGLDFPDWIEAVAPRPYAVISTTSDMFPFAGAQSSVAEARHFYALFGPDAQVQFITGPGGHGNLRPIAGEIVRFFLKNLAGSSAEPVALPQVGATAPLLPPEALQVTPTGQVLTSFPGAATVATLTRQQVAALPSRKHPSSAALQRTIREVTHATATPRGPAASFTELSRTEHPAYIDVLGTLTFSDSSGPAEIALPKSPGKHAAVLMLERDTAFEHLADAGNVVLAFTPRPSPPGAESTKSPQLGPFYLTELRAELVGKTILGMRVDDFIMATNFLASRPEIDAGKLTAQATGHLGLVLLHAAVLDSRLQHVKVDHALESYASLIAAPLTHGAPEDVLPGVIGRFDVDDLVSALGARLTLTNPINGAEDLSAPRR